MSRRRFLGWEPTRTVRQVDGATVVETEPEWDDSDRMWAVALQVLEADTCDGCGLPLSETLAPGAEIQAGVPARCAGCDELIRVSEAAAKRDDSGRTARPRPGALRWPLERTDDG